MSTKQGPVKGATENVTLRCYGLEGEIAANFNAYGIECVASGSLLLVPVKAVVAGEARTAFTEALHTIVALLSITRRLSDEEEGRFVYNLGLVQAGQGGAV